MSAHFVDVPALEDVITEGVEATSAWAEGFVSIISLRSCMQFLPEQYCVEYNNRDTYSDGWLQTEFPQGFSQY